MAFDRVRRPQSTIASATKGTAERPEKVADVYPYVTLATYFKASCLASICLRTAGDRFFTLRNKHKVSQLVKKVMVKFENNNEAN